MQPSWMLPSVLASLVQLRRLFSRSDSAILALLCARQQGIKCLHARFDACRPAIVVAFGVVFGASYVLALGGLAHAVLNAGAIGRLAVRFDCRDCLGGQAGQALG